MVKQIYKQLLDNILTRIKTGKYEIDDDENRKLLINAITVDLDYFHIYDKAEVFIVIGYYCGFPRIDIIGAELTLNKEKQFYRPDNDKALRIIQDELNEIYSKFFTDLKVGGWDIIIQESLVQCFVTYIDDHTNRDEAEFNKVSEIIKSKILTVLENTEGEEVTIEDIQLPLDFDYMSPRDEWPNLRIGQDRIINVDGYYKYNNGDVAAEAITNLFEAVKNA